MRNLIMDSQILNGVQLCGFKTDLTFNKNLRPLFKQSFFDDGDLMHEMFAEYYRGHMMGIEHKDRVEKAIEHGREHAISLDISLVEAEEIVEVALEYFDKHEFEALRVVAVEQPFAFILGESEEDDLRVIYVGKIDLVVQYPGDDLVVPWDHKTAKKRIDPHLLSNQFMGYCQALGVNMLEVNKVAFIKQEDKFKRYRKHYPQGLLDRWTANTMWWAKQLDFFMQTGTWPQNFTSCDKYGGCEFSKICEAQSIEMMEQAARVQYKVVEPWDVSKILAASKAIPLKAV